jgi:hypothetical protein
MQYFGNEAQHPQLISTLHNGINFYAAAKWWGYGIRMRIMRAGEVKN